MTKTLTFNVTGFKEFQGVVEDPAKTIVNNLRDFVKKGGLPKGVTLGSYNILKTAGDGALPVLCNIMESGNPETNTTCNEQVVWINAEVNSGALKFVVARQVVNEVIFYILPTLLQVIWQGSRFGLL